MEHHPAVYYLHFLDLIVHFYDSPDYLLDFLFDSTLLLPSVDYLVDFVRPECCYHFVIDLNHIDELYLYLMFDLVYFPINDH